MAEEGKIKKEPIVIVENLVKDYTVGRKQVNILKGLSFTIEPGEFVMVSGPSGCGKSTLMNILNSWEQPTEGKVTVDAFNFFSLSEKQRIAVVRSKIGMMSQSAFWVKSLSVLDNVAIPLLLAGAKRRVARERAMNLLKIVGLEQFANYKPIDLSGGQQQRVSFLRSVCNNPKILLADEPTGNLDSKSSDLLIQIFWALNSYLGITIVMVTHNPDLLSYASKVIYMKDGVITRIEVKREPSDKLINGMHDIVELSKGNLLNFANDPDMKDII